MKHRKRQDIVIHSILFSILFLTMLPFVFVVNNSLRSNTEIYHAFFGFPNCIRDMTRFTIWHMQNKDDLIMLKMPTDSEKTESVRAADVPARKVPYDEAMSHLWKETTKGYRYSWLVLRPYMVNTIFVCIITMLGVVTIGSISGYIFSRYKFPGNRFLFLIILSFMMIPHVLTLVPSFLLVKRLGMLNSYWVLILPSIAGGQVFAIFLFKGFFDGLPEALFESARLDGAGYFDLYWHIVLPLSKQVVAVVMVITILGTWNNFLWPFITNSDAKYHVVASGLYLMGQSQVASNFSTMFAAYILSSIPLLILFVYATKPFMQGVTSGAFKA
ncbi:MAG TPA: carbohydrate ABC transporter permease [Candidatus Brocadiia bacterium]|nr:carbohydrate ABC transporter permease [Candidatus Brocadiia bacterium]